jgi:hypothetical protein
MEVSLEPSSNEEGPWDLPINGWVVLTVIFAFQIDVLVYGDNGATCTIRLAGSFQLVDADGTVHRLDAAQQQWKELAPVLGLRHDRTTSAHVSSDATLAVHFASGRVLRADADGRPFEHWEINSPWMKLIAMPGDGKDGVTVWRHS